MEVRGVCLDGERPVIGVYLFFPFFFFFFFFFFFCCRMSDINEQSPKWGSKQSLVFFFGYYKYRYCTSFKGKRCLKLSLVKFLCLKLFHRSFLFCFVFLFP